MIEDRLGNREEKSSLDELERFKREINLVAFAEAQGYELDRQESSRSSVVMRHSGGDKIVIATNENGHGIYFSVRDETDNGSVIDFLQYRQGLSLGHVRKALREWITAPFSFPIAPKSYPKPEPIHADRAALNV